MKRKDLSQKSNKILIAFLIGFQYHGTVNHTLGVLGLK